MFILVGGVLYVLSSWSLQAATGLTIGIRLTTLKLSGGFPSNRGSRTGTALRHVGDARLIAG